MGISYDCSFGNVLVRHKGTLNLSRSHTVARDVYNVVYTPRDPVIAVLVLLSPVSGEIHTRKLAKIGTPKSLWFLVDSPHDTWPGLGNHQVSSFVQLAFLTLIIYDLGYNTWKGDRD